MSGDTDNALSELYALKLQTRKLCESAGIFAAFISMMDAGRELDGDEALSDRDILINYSGPGCGVFLTVGYFRELRNVLQDLYNSGIIAAGGDA